MSCETVLTGEEVAIALVKPSKDCYLVLNGKDWGAISSAEYSKVILVKGINVLEFKGGKEGIVLSERLINSYDNRQQVVNVDLPHSSQEKVQPRETVVEEIKEEKAVAERSRNEESTPSFPKESPPYYAMNKRRVVQKCDDYQVGNTSWNERGKAVVKICINEKGKVMNAELVHRKSTITNPALIDLVVGCAKQYRYERAPGAPNVCGEITIRLGLN